MKFKFFGWIGIFLLIFFFTASVNAAIYYVDQNHPKASDENPGTEELPWKTIQKAADTLVAGDIVLVKSGIYYQDGKCDVMTEWGFHTCAIHPRNSGTADKPIIYMAYPGDKVIIDGGGSYIGFYIYGLDYITIKGFEIQNTIQAGIWINYGSPNNIILEDLTIHDVDGKKGNNIAGIKLNGCANCIIRNTVIHNITANGDIANGHCIQSYDMTNTTIENNEMWNAAHGVFHKRSAGTKGAIIRNNLFHDIVSECVLYSISGTGNPPHIDQEFYQNICYNTPRGVRFDGGTETSSLHSGIYIYNNIFDVSDTGIWLWGCKSINIWNNIIRAGNYNIVTQTTENFFDLVNYNLYYPSENFILNRYTPSKIVYNSLFDWQVATNFDSNSLNNDPLFRNLETHDFHLRGNSPCIGTGIDRQDYDGDGNTTEPINMGAYITSNETIGLIDLSQYQGGSVDLTITTTSLSEGTVNQSYSATLEAIGGTPPYTWSRISGNLPNGLSLNSSTGEISGTPLSQGVFNFTIQVTDSASNQATQELSITIEPAPDTTPPTISAITTTNITESSVTITWQTDEPATSQVEYGTNTDYGSLTDLDSNLVTSHSVTITGLVPETLYHYRVRSQDANGNEAISIDHTFTTHPLEPGTYTVILGDTPDSDYPGTLEDTFININEENASDYEYLNTYTWPENSIANAIIMKWDLSNIPSSATIHNATLYLYLSRMGGDGGDDLYDLSVHKIINYNPVISACNGYTYDGINPWTPYSGLYNDIPLAQADIAEAEDTKSIDKTYGYKSWSVTNMVQEWVSNPDSNYGMLVNSDPVASQDSNRYFSSTESPNPDQRPKLVITYTISNAEPDITPPGEVSSFSVTPGNGQITLSWVNPTDDDFTGTMIRYRTDTYPTNFSDGILVCNKTASPGSSDSFIHTGLQNGTTYYYSAFTYDEVPNYSEGVHISATPTEPSPPPDTTNPTVTITQPTSADTYSTQNSSITLGGTASDNVGVTSITWENNRGGNGTASGTDNWSIPNISLQEGENVITVTAHDEAGNTATDSITVTYTNPLAITTESPLPDAMEGEEYHIQLKATGGSE